MARTPNAVEAVTANNAVVATLGYTKDQKSPKLLQFGFDLETGKLSMTFTEPVAPLTFKLDSVTLQGAKKLSAMVPQSKLTLKRGTVEEKDKNIAASMTITVKLVAEDVVAIKSDTGMYTSISDTYLSIAKGAVQDMVSLDVDAVDADAAMKASVHGADTSRGGVMKYVLDLAKRQVIFYFNEVVDVSSFKAGEITIQSGKTLASSESHRLTGGSKVIGTADTATVTVQLSTADHIKLGENAKLATADTNTYMMMTAGTADDILTRDLLAITDGNALQVDSVVADVTAPKITSATVDLTKATVALTFDEPINKLSFDEKGNDKAITLQGAAKAVTGTAFKVLTGNGGVVFNGNRDVVTLTLSTADLNAIKLNAKLAVNNEVFLSHTDKLIADLQGVKTVAVPQSAALSANLVADSTNPTLVGFSINMDTGKIVVTFDEPVKASSFKPAELTIQNAATASSGASYKLNGGEKSKTNGLELSVVMTVTDLNAIKYKAMGTSKGDTYMTLTADAVADMNSNKVTAVADKDGKPASAFVSDTRKPSLSSFTLDMTSGELAMTFSETVVPAKMVSTELTLQSGGNRATDANLFYKLQKEGTVSPSESTIVTLILAVEDMDALKALPKLAFSKPSTFLALTDKALTDVSKNPVEAKAPQAALQVSTYTGDVAKPLLEAFSVDLDAGTVALTFSETVNPALFVPTALTMQSSSTDTSSYTLLGGKRITQNASLVVEFELDKSDLEAIKRNDKLMTETKSSYLSALGTVIRDMNGNLLKPIPSSTGLLASAFKHDSTPPSVISFAFDLNDGALNISLSEPMANTIDVTQITLCSSNDLETYTLTKSTQAILHSSQMLVELKLSVADLDQIKARSHLATNLKSTLLTLTSGFAKDKNNVLITPISKANKVTPSNFNQDGTQPRLVSFVFDLETNQLRLTFSEAVNSTSIDVGGITLQDGTTSTSSYSLTGGNVFDPASKTQCPR